MGSCSSKQVIDIVKTSRDVIKTLVEVEKGDDECSTYKHLLTLLYNLDTYDKHTQKVILSMVEDKVKIE